MSSSDTTELVLPAWAVTRPVRRGHILRVMKLVGEWADTMGVSAEEKHRWQEAARLHDALRDATPAQLRPHVAPEFADWPEPVWHGPAAAGRLRADGCTDESLLKAITYHTIGHPELDNTGRMLFLADFLEPGRTFDPVGRAAWRARMPHDLTAVLREVLAARIQHILSSHRPLRRETLAFWNQVATS
ncbi:MAG TPA: HD domain-containing protein [Longimicrobiales bacterium]|nr:HD domain-containing protein [Longimicrobiales bacterium]